MGEAPVLPQVDETRCTLCGLCVEACPCHAVELGERGPIFRCPESCPNGEPSSSCCARFCICEEVCPTHAVECPFEIVVETEGDAGEDENG